MRPHEVDRLVSYFRAGLVQDASAEDSMNQADMLAFEAGKKIRDGLFPVYLDEFEDDKPSGSDPHDLDFGFGKL